MKFSFLGRKVMMILGRISWVVSFFSLFPESLIDGGQCVHYLNLGSSSPSDY